MGELIRANLKYHGRRYVATLVAVAIAVAFVAAALLFGGALNYGIRDQVAGQYVGAAVVLQPDYDQGGEPDLGRAQDVASDLAGVSETYGMRTTSVQSATGGPDAAWLVASVTGGSILRQVSLVEGTLPTTADQVVVTEATAEKMDLTVGSTMSVRGWEDNVVDLSVTGISRAQKQSIAIGADDLIVTGGAMDQLAPGLEPSEVLVALDTATPATSAQDTLAAEVTQALSAAGIADVKVQTGDEAVNAALEGINTSDTALTMMLLLFPVIAATVALIVVGTTFQVIFRQRERELALLRVIGATGRQVRNLMLIESVAVGLIGSLVGLILGVLGGAGLASAFSVVPTFAAGLTSISVVQVVILLFLGTALTAIAGFRPALRASRVAPISALTGGVESVRQRSRKQVIGGVVTGVATVIFGVWGAFLAFSTEDAEAKMQRFPLVLLLAVITVGFLIAFLSLTLPLFTRAMGRIGKSETFKLAAANTARNPGRTAATGVAVFIGVALIAMVTFGAESLRATSNSALDRSAPVDVIVMPTSASFTPEELESLDRITGIEGSVLVEGVDATIEVAGSGPDGADPESRMDGVLLADSGMGDVVRGGLDLPKGGEVLVPTWWLRDPSPVEVCVEENCQTLTGVPTEGVANGSGVNFVVSPETAQSFGAALEPTQMWFKLSNPSQYQDVIEQIVALGPDLSIEGAVGLRATIDQIVNVLVMVVVGLLAVSVLVAIVGITNTLSLSVTERTRENGLLRALGMSKKQVRLMLTWEALLIAVASTLLGVLAGAYFGAIGFASLPLGISALVFRVPWWQWLAIIVVAIMAALLASAVPGRNASRVSPVEALASE